MRIVEDWNESSCKESVRGLDQAETDIKRRATQSVGSPHR